MKILPEIIAIGLIIMGVLMECARLIFVRFKEYAERKYQASMNYEKMKDQDTLNYKKDGL